MNYIVIVSFSHDEEQNGGKPPPSSEEVIASLYENRLVPDGVLFDIKDIKVDRF
jgi:hypothetical protein